MKRCKPIPPPALLLTNATSGCCDGFTPAFAYGTIPTTDASTQFYANAAQASAAAQQYVTGPGLAKNSLSALVFGPPGTPLNGENFTPHTFRAWLILPARRRPERCGGTTPPRARSMFRHC